MSDSGGTQPAANDPDAIRSDIEQARADLADTVDKLSDKMNVKSQASDKVAAAKTKIADSAARAKSSAPPQVQQALDKAGEKAAPIAHQIGEKTEPHRSKIIAGAVGAFVLLWIVRRARRDDGDDS